MGQFYPVAMPELGGNELKYVTDCIQSGWVSSIGEYVNQFEKKFAEFCSVQYALSSCNGTAALHLALLGIGIKPGDEVIIPDLTFIATANSVTYCGARSVTVDVDPVTCNMIPEEVEKAVTEKTKAIIAVHLYGHPADMNALNKIAEKYDLYLVEDAAEAHGALVNGAKVGGLSHVSAFSFYGNKIITTGEGGMTCTSDPKIYDRMLLLRNHGMTEKRRYYHPVVGYNYRMTNLQAALGLAQLEQIDRFIEKKRWIASLYNTHFKDFPYIEIPVELDGYKSVFWLYAPKVSQNSPISRDELCKRLAEKNVQTRPYFYPVSEMPDYKNCKTGANSKDLSERGFNLPCYTTITAEDIQIISDLLKSCYV